MIKTEKERRLFWQATSLPPFSRPLTWRRTTGRPGTDLIYSCTHGRYDYHFSQQSRSQRLRSFWSAMGSGSDRGLLHVLLDKATRTLGTRLFSQADVLLATIVAINLIWKTMSKRIEQSSWCHRWI